MSYDKTKFVSFCPAYNVSVILPDQNRYKVDYVGNVRLSKDLCLINVLYVPQFAYNLMSTSALLKNDTDSVLILWAILVKFRTSSN